MSTLSFTKNTGNCPCQCLVNYRHRKYLTDEWILPFSLSPMPCKPKWLSSFSCTERHYDGAVNPASFFDILSLKASRVCQSTTFFPSLSLLSSSPLIPSMLLAQELYESPLVHLSLKMLSHLWSENENVGFTQSSLTPKD